MGTPPNLPSLTPDERIWRLDWFGECAYPGNVRRYAQPSVRVALSPVSGDPAEQASSVSTDGKDRPRQHLVWVPVSVLPMLAIGDLWQNGQHVDSPQNQWARFKKLTVVAETTAFVKSGLAIDDCFLLPLDRHPWHRPFTQSYCVAVTLDEHRRLLVPCMEIIRFYFGSSGNLLQRLFTAPLAPERLWAHKQLNPDTRHLHLVLAERLSGASATDIGRIAESGWAWRAAAGIYASCQKATAAGLSPYPYTGFPFEGLTDLDASGIWLPFGEREDATFLAYRLHSCSHPFPFKSLSYEASDRKKRFAAPDGPVSERDTRFSRSSHTDRKPETVETDPGTGKAQRRPSFVSNRHFVDLQRKQVWREKIEAISNADVFLRHEDGSLEQVAFGESVGSSSVLGIDAGQVQEGGADMRNGALPRFVRQGLKSIETQSILHLLERRTKIVCLPGRQEPVFALPVVIDEDGVIPSQLFFTEGDGSVRQRRGCFVEVVDTGSPPRNLLILEGAQSGDAPQILLAHRVELACAVNVASGTTTHV